MAIDCPHCRKRVGWWHVKRSFKCPHCAAALTARVTGLWVATVVLWSLAELPVLAVLSSTSDTFAVAVVRAAVSLGLGVVVASVLFRVFGRISTSAQSND